MPVRVRVRVRVSVEVEVGVRVGVPGRLDQCPVIMITTAVPSALRSLFA